MIPQKQIRYKSGMKLKNIVFAAFPFGLFLICARGLLELALPKSAAYVVQAVQWVVLLLLIIVATGSREKYKPLSRTLKLSFLLILISLASFLYTSTRSGTWDGGVYFFVIFMWCVLSVIGSGFICKIPPEKIARSSIICIIVLALTATLQQLDVIIFLPGISWGLNGIRPSSLTGSYLHYPVVMFFLSLICFQYAEVSKKNYFYVFGVAGVIFSVISYSRSAVVMLALVASYMAVFYIAKKKSPRTIIIGAGFLFSWLVVVLVSPEILNRALSAFDISSAGNSQRVLIWVESIEALSWDSLLVGGYFGQVTNTTSNMTDSASRIVESSLLQQFFNVGVLGAIVFYMLVYLSHKSISRSHVFLKGGAFAFIVQSLAYQNIEVFPAIALFTLLPLFSSALLDSQKTANSIST